MKFPPQTFGLKCGSPEVTRLMALALAMVATSCERHLPDKIEIPETRSTFSTEGDIPAPAPASTRFGTKGQAMFPWTAPEGWTLMPSTEFRELNFTFGPQKEGECYMALTGGGEGSTINELNRWRKQMNASPVEASVIETLPKETLFNRPTPFVDLSGDYTPAMAMNMSENMPKPPARPDYRLLGLIMEVPTMKSVVTVKMIGPKDVVAANFDKFKAFAKSLGQPAAQ